MFIKQYKNGQICHTVINEADIVENTIETKRNNKIKN
jgi:hypothetical protein